MRSPREFAHTLLRWQSEHPEDPGPAQRVGLIGHPRHDVEVHVREAFGLGEQDHVRLHATDHGLQRGGEIVQERAQLGGRRGIELRQRRDVHGREEHQPARQAGVERVGHPPVRRLQNSRREPEGWQPPCCGTRSSRARRPRSRSAGARSRCQPSTVNTGPPMRSFNATIVNVMSRPAFPESRITRSGFDGSYRIFTVVPTSVGSPCCCGSGTRTRTPAFVTKLTMPTRRRRPADRDHGHEAGTLAGVVLVHRPGEERGTEAEHRHQHAGQQHRQRTPTRPGLARRTPRHGPRHGRPAAGERRRCSVRTSVVRVPRLCIAEHGVGGDTSLKRAAACVTRRQVGMRALGLARNARVTSPASASGSTPSSA